jgi:hypothetical protein
MPGSPHLLILNPLGSGQANSVAQSLLEFLRSADATDAAKRFPLIGKKVVEENILPPIRSWVLDDVVADPNSGLAFEYFVFGTKRWYWRIHLGLLH